MIPVPLLVKILKDATLSRLAVLGLWELSRRTPGTVDDEVVKALAGALNVTLPRR